MLHVSFLIATLARQTMKKGERSMYDNFTSLPRITRLGMAVVGIAGLTVMVSGALAAQTKGDKKTKKPAAVKPIKKPAAPRTLLTNPGFENGSDGQPAGWQQGAEVGGVEYLWDKNAAHQGKASLCLRKTAQRYFPIAQWSQVIPN